MSPTLQASLGSTRGTEWLLTGLCVVGITAGQILFRLAAQRLDSSRLWASALGSPWLWVALAVYGLATLLWIHVLRTAPLHRVYPLFALAFVCVPLVEHWVWQQPMRWQSWVGGALIVAGVAVSVGTFDRLQGPP
jgi:drug/metabolite transporter (DMT)-like permease